MKEENKDDKNWITYMAQSINTRFYNPKKAWQEVVQAIKNIYVNFTSSKINPDKLFILLREEAKNTSRLPEVTSIEKIIHQMEEYIKEFRISSSTTLFLELKRLCAVYSFSAGNFKLSIDYLTEVIQSVDEENGLDTEDRHLKNKDDTNIDINKKCVRDCAQLNLAAINFWMEQYDEAKAMIFDRIQDFETTDNELYHIKMVNFISVGLCYLAWIHAREGREKERQNAGWRADESDKEAEKCFFMAVKLFSNIKYYVSTKKKEKAFLNMKPIKVCIYDQLIVYYTFKEQYEKVPIILEKILKLMDYNFKYNIDITPTNHVIYYLAAAMYALSPPEHGEQVIELKKAIQYMCNAIVILYQQSDSFENALTVDFYEKIFKLISIYRINGRKESIDLLNDISQYDEKKLKKIDANISYVVRYLNGVIGNHESSRVLSLGSSESGFKLEMLGQYLKNKSFSEFNFITNILEKEKSNYLEMEYKGFFNEITLIKLISERILVKFAELIKLHHDCITIGDKIVLEGLNGFLEVENEELVLYQIYKFKARDDTPNVNEEVKVHLEEDIKTKHVSDEVKRDIIKVISVKNLEFNFLPLYYKRITFQLKKDKTFNFPVYFGLINTLYAQECYEPCIILLSLFINEIALLVPDLYSQVDSSQRVNIFLHLYEFLLFLQAYLYCKVDKYDRALYELMKIQRNVNEMNSVIYKSLLGLCLVHCFYYELGIVVFCEAVHLIKPLVDMYAGLEDGSPAKSKDEENQIFKPKTPEAFLKEMRALMSALQCFSIKTFDLLLAREGKDLRICFRCRKEDPKMYNICLQCKKAFFCSEDCKTKNMPVHSMVCKAYFERAITIKKVIDEMKNNHYAYALHIKGVLEKREKDRSVLEKSKDRKKSESRRDESSTDFQFQPNKSMNRYDDSAIAFNNK